MNEYNNPSPNPRVITTLGLNIEGAKIAQSTSLSCEDQTIP